MHPPEDQYEKWGPHLRQHKMHPPEDQYERWVPHSQAVCHPGGMCMRLRGWGASMFGIQTASTLLPPPSLLPHPASGATR
eukprot:360786-Chlamydomonas_euryale.AAC.1